MHYPDWWHKAEPGIDAAVSGFVDWMERKVEALQPHQLIVKNPFLFRARSPENVEQFADRLIEAFLSSSEETRFGDILEEIAIAICSAAKGGWKSGIPSIDIEYEEKNTRTIIQVKSGTKWGNSSQRKKLVQDFMQAKKVIRQNNREIQVRAVEGICYGSGGIKDEGTHYRIIGNDFWESISGWDKTAYAAFDIISAQAGNGLSEARKVARQRIVDYLRRTDAIYHGGSINWTRVLDLIMMPTKQRPK